MECSWGFKIIKEENLLVQYYSGNIFLNDFIELLEALYRHPDYSPRYNILADAKDANIIFEDEQIDDLLAFLASNKRYENEKKLVYLSNTPNQVVAGMLFAKLSGVIQLEVNVVSTIEAAALLLGLKNDKLFNLKHDLLDLKSVAVTK